MSTLYVVATPIGNLTDLTERARAVLTTVPAVFAEDTRRARVLLGHVGATPRLYAYHHHTPSRRLASLLDVLASGDAALVTDAGTPGVSDPGGVLISAALDRFGDALKVVPVPGPSAIAAAASVSGFPMDSFRYLGFPPHKKGRRSFFDDLAATASAVIFLESPYRIQRTLRELVERQSERRVVVCRELTKQFETTYRGTAREVSRTIDGERPRGEYVVVVAPHLFALDNRQTS